jgi:hypothetical protein
MRRSLSLIALVLLVAACDTEPTSPETLIPEGQPASLEVIDNSTSESPMGPGAVKVDAGAYFACAFYPQDGNVNCFGVFPVEKVSPRTDGSGWYGERADYMGGDAIAFASGDWSSCVLLATGNTHCWGENASKYTYAGGDAIQLAVGYSSSCVLTKARNVSCAGGYVGGAGDAWKQVYGGGDAEWVAMSSYAACIKKEGSNTLTCFGWNVSEPQWVTTGTPTPQAGGHYAMCMRMAEGTVDCMNNSYNEVGQTKVPVGLTGVVDIDGQFDRTCAVLSNGDIRCWGRNHPTSGATHQTWSYAGVGAVNVAVTYQDVCYSTAAGTTACIRSTPDKYTGSVRDATPPVITPTVSGALGQNGWYTSNVGISWSVTDPDSPVSAETGCDAASVTADTNGQTFTCAATSEGGTSTKSVTIKRDATKPTIGYTPGSGSYTVDQTVSIACAAGDALSGLASDTCANVSGEAYTFAIGQNTRSATAVDVAGNTNAASVTFEVSVTNASLCTLVKRWVSQVGVAQSMCKQLQNGAYGAFRNHVEAQSGKSVSAQNATILINLSNRL